MTSSIDISFITPSSTTAASSTDAGKTSSDGGMFGDIFSEMTDRSDAPQKESKGTAQADAEDEANAQGKSGAKTASARDPASFGRLLQQWANGEQPAAADQAAAANGEGAEQASRSAARTDSSQVDLAATPPAAAEAEAAPDGDEQTAKPAAGAEQDEDAVQSKPHPSQTTEKSGPLRGAEDDIRKATLAAGDDTAQTIGRTDDVDLPSTDTGEETASEERALQGDARQTATGTDLAAGTLPGSVAGQVAQQQIGMKNAPASAHEGQSAAHADGTESRAAATASAGDGNDQPGLIQVKVTRRETHFAPVLDLAQRQASANAGTEATAPQTPARSAGAQIAAAVEAVAKADPLAKTVTAAQTDTVAKAETTAKAEAASAAKAADRDGDMTRADSENSDSTDSGARQAAAGERISAASTPTGVGTTSGTGFSALTSLPFATATQVSRAITEEAARMRSGQPAGPQTTTQGPVRILEMTVTPESLGRVVIHMRLTTNGLEVRVRATEAATAQMLAQDHHALVRIIEASGTKVDSLDIVKSISSPVEASVRTPWTSPQSSGSGAEQDAPERREQGRQGGNSGKEQANDDAQSGSRRSSDAFDG